MLRDQGRFLMSRAAAEAAYRDDRLCFDLRDARRRGKLASEVLTRVRFAERVLAILEDEGDWSSGTLDRIASAAIEGDLARTDTSLMFERVPS